MQLEILRNDTIVAVSTPPGRGAIGIIRMSGPQTMDILKKICVRPNACNEYPPYQLIHGAIKDGNRIIDDILTFFFPKGKSYTGDDLIEIHAHGNPLILSDIMEIIQKLGARLARPGEFTFRRYMNGRMDLLQAEAVLDLIEAKSQAALAVANRQLRGDFSREIIGLRDEFLYLLTHLEAAIDFSTEDIEIISPNDIYTKTMRLKEKISRILNSYSAGRWLTDGIKVAIVGRPNVGKSSLLNALLKKERAIVTAEAGTTRDTIEEELTFQGHLFHLIDTAGIRRPENNVERLGISKSFEKIESSDLSILVLDISWPLDKNDLELIEKISSKRHVVALNKMDLTPIWDFNGLKSEYSLKRFVKISALHGKGIDNLLMAVYEEVIGKDVNSDAVLLTKARHKETLEKALGCLEAVQMGIQEKRSPEFLSFDLKEGVTRLEEIIGQIGLEDVYDKIFSSFCIGK